MSCKIILRREKIILQENMLLGTASHAEARSKQLEREGKFLVAQVEDGVVAAGRAKRSAPKVVTEEQLLAIASQPIKRSRKAAQEAKPARWQL